MRLAQTSGASGGERWHNSPAHVSIAVALAAGHQLLTFTDSFRAFLPAAIIGILYRMKSSLIICLA
jgi:hypothetical protein